MSCTQLCDSPERYGLISRLFHWGMALVLLWQFTSVIIHTLFEKTAIDKFFWGTHKAVGTLIMLLILLRVLWALVNLRRRPPAVSIGSITGHIVLYALMLAIPTIALIRQYGSGKAFSPFGIPLMHGFEETNKIEWMIDLGSNFHGLLGWTLLVAVLGHGVAVLWHYLRGDRYVLERMK
ncbi:MAG TPA: cytochrome B [Pusillimonas sp.]|jgi:cytochrome b561|nr:cytochrome B [Pusillimonas sp.]MBC43649.1 cytochrome B [Pusillimonas sp.]HBT32991.1 cytochrome B [Pusillimonas sp.]HCN70636.1 cytochrome B [Pusillimonas sp.]